MKIGYFIFTHLLVGVYTITYIYTQLCVSLVLLLVFMHWCICVVCSLILRVFSLHLKCETDVQCAHIQTHTCSRHSTRHFIWSVNRISLIYFRFFISCCAHCVSMEIQIETTTSQQTNQPTKRKNETKPSNEQQYSPKYMHTEKKKDNIQNQTTETWSTT